MSRPTEANAIDSLSALESTRAATRYIAVKAPSPLRADAIRADTAMGRPARIPAMMPDSTVCSMARLCVCARPNDATGLPEVEGTCPGRTPGVSSVPDRLARRAPSRLLPYFRVLLQSPIAMPISSLTQRSLGGFPGVQDS